MLRSGRQAASRSTQDRADGQRLGLILRCADGSYYVGSARGADMGLRLAEHENGAFPGYTATRRPVTLVHCEGFERMEDAISAERQIKGWSRAKKEALIAEAFDRLPELSRRKKAD